MSNHATLLPDSATESGPKGHSGASKRPHPLSEALSRHVAFERASFHTPGHKGRAVEIPSRSHDLTELPGLDDLSSPQGLIRDLEARAALVWGASESIISVNGASAGLAASLLALSSRGSTVLVPRNAHRSVVAGLILSGLFPLWYEPIWEDEWSLWGGVSATSAERLLARSGGELAGMVVVSPTYAGALSDIHAIANICQRYGVPLIVDEAHGAHFLPSTGMPLSAVAAGADVVVHSLHKTLPALTQTGLVHIGHNSAVAADSLRSAIGLIHSSSPSYLLLASVEQAIASLEGGAGLSLVHGMLDLSAEIVQLALAVPEIEIYAPGGGTSPTHLFLRLRDRSAERLYSFLCDQGIFPETILGEGVLLLLGTGSDASDIACLRGALLELGSELRGEPVPPSLAALGARPGRPPEAVQILSPRQASLMPSEVVPVHQAVGRIAAELIAPCPPGTPVVIAGQRVPREILEFASLQTVRVVIE